MYKRIFAAMLAAVLSLSLAGCGKSEEPVKTPETQNPAQETTLAAPVEETATGILGEKRTQYPLTITTYNFAREQVDYTFEKAPERVYVQNQNNIEILLALGLGDRIVSAYGLDGEIRPDLADEFAKIPVRDAAISKEELLALQPDFIAGWYSTFSDKRLGDVDFWQERGIGTYMSLNSGCRGNSADAPQTIDEECQDILNLGMIFDVQERAEALVAEIQSEVQTVADFLEGKERIGVAVLEDEGGTYRVYSEYTLGGNVAVSGGAELTVGGNGQSGNISAEDLIAANPEAIFMVWYDGYAVGDTDYAGDHVVKLITENPAFASLDAVKNGRVYPINLSGIYCSGMRTLDGILDFSRNLYPELYQ